LIGRVVQFAAEIKLKSAPEVYKMLTTSQRYLFKSILENFEFLSPELTPNDAFITAEMENIRNKIFVIRCNSVYFRTREMDQIYEYEKDAMDLVVAENAEKYAILERDQFRKLPPLAEATPQQLCEIVDIMLINVYSDIASIITNDYWARSNCIAITYFEKMCKKFLKDVVSPLSNSEALERRVDSVCRWVGMISGV